jgi:tRNA threonylcarbamoyladenosine biosynthesis protein TsaE
MSTLQLANPAATHALGVALGRAAFPGAVLALVGELGAGKTGIARGIAEGLAVPGRVTSPTFVIVQVHDGGRLPFAHADLYRLGDASELDAIGFADVLAAGGVVAVEWADRFPDALPADRLVIALSEAGDARVAELTATGPRHAALEAVHGPA